MCERYKLKLREDGEVDLVVSDEPIKKGKNLINCVAYSAIYVEGGGQVHPQCFHPDICEGGRFGCELVASGLNEKAERISDAKCIYQVKRGSKEALLLKKRIDEMLAPKF